MLDCRLNPFSSNYGSANPLELRMPRGLSFSWPRIEAFKTPQ